MAFHVNDPLVVAAIACAVLPGCSDDTGTATDSDGATTSTGPGTTSTGEPTPTTGVSASSTTTPTTGGTTTEPTTGTTTDATSTTGDVGPCSTLLCGPAGTCCPATFECHHGDCLPPCESGVRCGADDSICCPEGHVCLADMCTDSLGPCQGPGDCEAGQYCELELGQCVPLPDPLDCQLVPDSVDLALEWEWTVDQVVSTPMVADVDADGAPDVVVSTTAGGMSYPLGEIVLLDGTTGAEKWRIAHDPDTMRFGSLGRATVAVGDVDGDAVPDIVYAGRLDANKLSPIHAVDGLGNLLWTSRHADDTPARVRVENGSATLVNLDADPQAEVVFGAAILDHDGLLVWDQGGMGGVIGTPLNNGQLIYPGGLATLADLDGDGTPELVTGREAWKIDWVAGDPPTVTLSQFWANDNNPNPNHNNDGWPAVADLDGDGKPEVVLVAWPVIRVLNGQTGQLWCGVDPTDATCQNDPALRTQPIAIKGGNLGGPATIADFDGDGRPEAAITGGAAFAVYDFHRPGEDIVKPMFDPMPAAGAMYARWTASVQDNSSAATGASAFDFQGDGAAEVLQQDECFVRVFDGATGAVMLELMNSSATIHEYPLVVDVDGDGAFELLAVANLATAQNIADCTGKTPGFAPRQGVFAYRAQAHNWASARALWTQHTYHVTNADDAGNPPIDEVDNWSVPGLNNFRQGTAGSAQFGAADLTVTLAAHLGLCPADLELVATVHNEGAIGVPAGIEVGFYNNFAAPENLIGTAMTTEGIVPGGSTQVGWVVPAPPLDVPKSFAAAVDPNDAVAECGENNNAVILVQAGCP